MGKPVIPHNRPSLGKEEAMAATRVIQSNWVAQGKEVEKFENELCDFLQIKHGSAVAVASGTAALYLALLALGASGKRVAIPFFTCNALQHAVTLAGGRALFVDSRLEIPNMDLDKLESETAFAIVPHMFGIPQKIPKKMKSIIIEDCAQSLGAAVGSTAVGLQGEIGVFSFYATKVITSGGQGGMIVSRNHAYIDWIKDFRHFDARSDGHSRFNFQMTDLQAAIGREQLKKLPQFQARREAIFDQYKNAGLPLVDVAPPIYPVRFRALLQTERQQELMQALQKDGIHAAIPITESEWMGSSGGTGGVSSMYWSNHLISLPLYPTLTDKEVKRVIRSVGKVL